MSELASRRSGIARAAALLVGLTAVSQLLGFVRDAVIAGVFGASAALDAYLVAQGAMNLVLALVAGAAARAIVPPLSRAAAAGEADRANRLVQTGLTVTVLVLVFGSLLMLGAADHVVAVLAPGFDPTTAALAADLTRVVLAATVFVAATDLLVAAAQAHGRFLHSGLQGSAFNVVMIGAALGFGAGHGVDALAVGFVVGSAARLLVQLPAVRAAGLRLRPRLAVRDADVREALRLAPPILLGGAVVNVNTLVDRAVGSGQGEGTIAALNFGWRVVTLADTLLVATVAAALYPALSTLGAPERRADLRLLLQRSLRVMLVVLAPVVGILTVAAEPIVRLVFGHGHFDATAVNLTALAVSWYAAGALGLGLRVVASRACYAVGDGRTPVTVAVVAMTVNVVGDLTLGVAYGVPGLAASTTASLAVGAGLMLVLMARRHDAVDLRDLSWVGLRVAVATAAAMLVGAAVAGSIDADGSTWRSLGELAAVGTLVIGTYAAGLVAMRGRDLAEIEAIVRARLPIRRRPRA